MNLWCSKIFSSVSFIPDKPRTLMNEPCYKLKILLHSKLFYCLKSHSFSKQQQSQICLLQNMFLKNIKFSFLLSKGIESEKRHHVVVCKRKQWSGSAANLCGLINTYDCLKVTAKLRQYIIQLLLQHSILKYFSWSLKLSRQA